MPYRNKNGRLYRQPIKRKFRGNLYYKLDNDTKIFMRVEYSGQRLKVKDDVVPHLEMNPPCTQSQITKHSMQREKEELSEADGMMDALDSIDIETLNEVKFSPNLDQQQSEKPSTIGENAPDGTNEPCQPAAPVTNKTQDLTACKKPVTTHYFNREQSEKPSTSSENAPDGTNEPHQPAVPVTNKTHDFTACKKLVTTHYFNKEDLPNKCVVPTCSAGKNPHFSFPADSGICLKWLRAIPMIGWKLESDSAVCSLHFASSDIIGPSGDKTLVYGAVPQLYLKDPPPVADVEPSTEQNDEATMKIKLNDDGDDDGDLEIIEPVHPMVEISSDEDAPPPAPVKSNPSPMVSNFIAVPLSQLQSTLMSTRRCCVPFCNSMPGKPPGIGFHTFPRPGEMTIKIQMPQDRSIVKKDLHAVWKYFISTTESSLNMVVCTRHFIKRDYNEAGRLKKTAIPTQFLPKRPFSNPLPVIPTQLNPVSGSAANIAFSVRPIGSSANASVRIVPPDCPVSVMKPIAPAFISQSDLNISTAVAGQSGVPAIASSSKMLSQGPTVGNFQIVGLPGNTAMRQVVHQPGHVFTFNKGRTATQVANVGVPNTSASLKRLDTLSILGKRSLGTSSSRIILQKNTSLRLPISTANSILSVKNDLPLPKRYTPTRTMKSRCSVPKCPSSKTTSLVPLFKLPPTFDKCKEWIYSIGCPDWLDHLDASRLYRRICSRHFSPDMFVNERSLIASAVPIGEGKASYPKCVIKSCQNYFDSTRLYLIGVEFTKFPQETSRAKEWARIIKSAEGNNEPVEEGELDKFLNAVICSLHFKNSDYVITASGKELNESAVPSLYLCQIVQEPKVQEAKPNPPDNKSLVRRPRGRPRGGGVPRSGGKSKGRGSSKVKGSNDTSRGIWVRQDENVEDVLMATMSLDRRSTRTAARSCKSYRFDTSDSESSSEDASGEKKGSKKDQDYSPENDNEDEETSKNDNQAVGSNVEEETDDMSNEEVNKNDTDTAVANIDEEANRNNSEAVAERDGVPNEVANKNGNKAAGANTDEVSSNGGGNKNDEVVTNREAEKAPNDEDSCDTHAVEKQTDSEKNVSSNAEVTEVEDPPISLRGSKPRLGSKRSRLTESSLPEEFRVTRRSKRIRTSKQQAKLPVPSSQETNDGSDSDTPLLTRLEKSFERDSCPPGIQRKSSNRVLRQRRNAATAELQSCESNDGIEPRTRNIATNHSKNLALEDDVDFLYVMLPEWAKMTLDQRAELKEFLLKKFDEFLKQ